MTFNNNRVLRDVALSVEPGEIHALVGQNGSGKSTLAKVLTGLYTPDAGTRVAVDGVDLRLPVRPDESRERGVAVVHQSLGLVDAFSVIDNMRIGRLKGSGPFRRINWKRERESAIEVFERLGRSVPLDVPVGSLHEEERATVAIARAMQDATPGRGLIIFDESTRALSRRSLEHFFEMLDGIVRTGTAALLITHRLEEVVDAADRVTVLRDGRVVESGRTVEGMTEAELTRLILGRNLSDLEARSPAREFPELPPVSVRSVSGLGVTDVSIDIRPGEVVGLTGLAGSGYDDVPYLITGATPASTGTLSLGGEELELSRLTPARAMASGIALVPEGREYSGLAMTETVSENIALPLTSRNGGIKPLSRKAERSIVEDWIEKLDVRPRLAEATVGNFSGGNQQKVFLSKWLATDPAFVVLHEPTQAVDVGARHTIVAAVRDAAATGRAVLVAGADENELSLLCDRVLIFNHGVVKQELRDDLSPDSIVQAIYAQGTRSRLRKSGRPAQLAD